MVYVFHRTLCLYELFFQLYKGFDIIAVERLNGINNREGVENRNKMFKELLIANYPIKELYERQAD